MSVVRRGRLLRGKQLFLFQSCLFKAVFRLILRELHTYSPPVFSQIHLYLPTHSIFLPLVSFLFKPGVQSVLPSPLGRRAICCSVVDWSEVPSLMETTSPFPRSYYQWCLSQGWDFMSTSEGESWWVTEKTDRQVHSANWDTLVSTHTCSTPTVCSFLDCSSAELDRMSLLCVPGRTDQFSHLSLWRGLWGLVPVLSFLLASHCKGNRNRWRLDCPNLRKRKRKRGKPCLMLGLESGWLLGLSWGIPRKYGIGRYDNDRMGRNWEIR